MKLRIHHEGKSQILLSGLLAVLVSGISLYFLAPTSYWWIAAVLSVGAWLFFGIMVNFYRNPKRMIELNDEHILAPCDGKIVSIEQVFDKVYFNEKVIQIGIFMSPFNVHVNRNPIGGEIKFYKYFKGKYLFAFLPKSSMENEHSYLVAANKHVTVAYKQIAGGLARRLCCYVKVGDQVRQGTEFGFIKLGSRVDVLIPVDCKVTVKLNATTKGGKTVLAKIRLKEGS